MLSCLSENLTRISNKLVQCLTTRLCIFVFGSIVTFNLNTSKPCPNLLCIDVFSASFFLNRQTHKLEKRKTNFLENIY
jgi:hypothetical protein